MEPNESGGLSSYFAHAPPHHPHPHHPPTPTNTTTTPPPTNGILPNNNNPTATTGAAVYGGGSSLPSAVSPPSAMEGVKRKRGRPRKYSTPEQAAAAKRLSSASAPPKKRDHHGGGGAAAADGSSKKTQLAALGNAGQGFMPHIINVSAGEDVGQKIMMFMQQSKHELCVLSASGAISNASLRQPATSGGSITYEGRFDILTLSGSYVRTEIGGRTGGLSVCLASTDGQIIGGGVGGPLIAGGPIQVIVGSFSVDSKTGAVNRDISPQIGGSPISSAGFRSVADSSHQSMGGGQFMMQSRGMQPSPLHSNEWRVSPGQGLHQSPENGDYDHLQD